MALAALLVACGDDPSGNGDPYGGAGGAGGEGGNPDCITVWPGGERQEWCRPEGWGPWVCWTDPETSCHDMDPAIRRPMACYRFPDEFDEGQRYTRTCHPEEQCRLEVLDPPACCEGVELTPEEPIGWCAI